MNKRQKRACVLLLAGVIFLCASMGIHLFQQHQDRLAGQTAALLLQQLELSRIPVAGEQVSDAEVSDPLLPQRQYMDYRLIGSISVPSVGIHLPVLDGWSESLLKIAPCRYTGSLSGGNLVVMGHNYKSHFTPLLKVQPGDEVTFANADGKVFHFRVAEVQTLHREDGEQLASDYPLTVFTCTPGGIYRYVVRCEAVNE